MLRNWLSSETTTPRRLPVRRHRKWVWIIIACLLALLLAAAAITPGLERSLGGRLSGERLERARRSPHFANGKFHNSEPDHETSPAEARRQLTHGLFGNEERIPTEKIPVVVRHTSDFETQSDSGLRLTWMGHSSVLIELDGRRMLTDPVWSERASPLAWIGPKRFHPAPISLRELPRIDVVVISHDHYDHLDMATVQALAARGTYFVVPLGVGAHLEAWGVPSIQYSELDWDEQIEVAGLKFIATPARHYSGRNPFHTRETLWDSWVVQSPAHRIFFSGDTGYSNDFKIIGTKYGPFDVTLMKVGGSDPSWADIHMTPEQAVRAHIDVQGKVMLPVHWGTFNLAFHSWKEPVERVLAAAEKKSVVLVVPKPGQLVDPSRLPPSDYWWRSIK